MIKFHSRSGFAEIQNTRCACLLLLDNSMSMRGSPITLLNEGLKAFHDELAADALASKRMEVAIVTFGPVKTSWISRVPNTFSRRRSK